MFQNIAQITMKFLPLIISSIIKQCKTLTRCLVHLSFMSSVSEYIRTKIIIDKKKKKKESFPLINGAIGSSL